MAFVDYLAMDMFPPERRLMQYGLSDQNAAKHLWYSFPRMQMGEVLVFKQFDSDTALPGSMTFHTAFVDLTAKSRRIRGCLGDWRTREERAFTGVGAARISFFFRDARRDL